MKPVLSEACPELAVALSVVEWVEGAGVHLSDSMPAQLGRKKNLRLSLLLFVSLFGTFNLVMLRLLFYKIIRHRAYLWPRDYL